MGGGGEQQRGKRTQRMLNIPAGRGRGLAGTAQADTVSQGPRAAN